MASTKLELLIQERQRRLRRAIGEELRRIRADQGLSVRAVSRAAGLHHSHLARIEAGDRDASPDALVALATSMGHDVSFRCFPTDGPRVRDHIQVRMVEALLKVLDDRWVARLEVPVYRPARGVIDLLLQERQRHDLVAGEGHSVLSAVERQLRWAAMKADSLPSARGWPFANTLEQPTVSRLLILRSCRAMHELVDAAVETFGAAYPARTSDAVDALTGPTTRWPGAAIVWVDVRGRDSRLLEGLPRALRRA